MIAVEAFLRALFQISGGIQWNVGQRARRIISISSDGRPLVQNLFTLSTGESVLLDLFLSIVRDFDVAQGEFNSLADIKGIVVVDEIDLHLHSELQYSILPQLIKLFPSVQFIVTTHSPLFVLGLNKALGEGGFALFSMPTGIQIDAERFSEFGAAYEYLRESERFSSDVRAAVEESHMPLLFVEGPIDMQYLQRAAEALGRHQSLNSYRLRDANGYGGLNRIWKHYEPRLAEVLPQKVVLLYDCEVDTQAADKATAYRRLMPYQDRKVKTGVENLLPDELISRAREFKPEFH